MKNLLSIVCAVVLFLGCDQAVKQEAAPPVVSSTQVLVVNYELNDLTLEDHAVLGGEVVANFEPGKVAGLIGKTFIGNVDTGVFGGVYYFTDAASLDGYLNSELWKGIVAHPNLVNFKTDAYGVAAISGKSNGLADQRKMASLDDDISAAQVLVVNYELSDLTLEDHAALGGEVVANFEPGKVAGLIGKTFIGNVDTGVFGGVYYFTDAASLDGYLNSELWKGIVAHPNLVNFKTDVYGVAAISQISNGIPVL